MAPSDRDVTPRTSPQAGAGRYARRRRNLKIALPLIALGTLGFIFLLPRDDIGSGLGLSPEDRAALGDGLRLVSPTFAGSTEQGEPFSLTAAWALPDSPNPKRIDLGDLEGRIRLSDGRTVNMSAPEGQFRPRDRGLTLKGGIAIDSSDGYSVRTDAAVVDGKANTVVADAPVEAWGPSGRLEAGSMRARRDETGKDIVTFDGGVRLVFRPNATNDAAPGGESGSDGTGGGLRQP